MTQNINRTRRSLLAGGTMAALAAATRAAHAKEGAPAFDKIYDVIVVGSGFAGLAAALQARLKGAEVLLIEKMPVFGGNSAINGGAFAVAGSPLQEKEGIKDSPERMLQDMIRSGRGLSHVDLLKMIVEGTRPAFDFTLEHGVQYKPFVQHFGGHSVPRIMQTVGRNICMMSPLAAWVVVVAQSLVLFLFASDGLHDWLEQNGIPALPLVPVSSSQAVIGAVIGIGLFKGGHGINWNLIGRIFIGWIATPVMAALICFVSLFFLENVFNLAVYD